MKSFALVSRPRAVSAVVVAVAAIASLASSACISTGGPPELLGEDGGASSSLITNGSDMTADAGASSADAADDASGDH